MSTQLKFPNRSEAGRRLAEVLSEFAGLDNVILLALPRGGVPVAAEIARKLHLPFDVLLVRKLGVPGHEELAFGAIASGSVRVLSEDLISMLGITRKQIESVTQLERSELERREKFYRNGRAAPAVAGNTVILVDDGIATGSTMSAAIELLRHQGARKIIVAVPVAPPDAIKQLSQEADKVITLLTPDPFEAVGRWYHDFPQTDDNQVRKILAEIQHQAKPGDSIPADCPSEKSVLTKIREHAKPLTGSAGDYDGLLEMIGDSSIVLLGEATHGTHEFYHQRAVITKRLIEEKGFNAVAIEGDWPDAYQVNRYVRGESDCKDAVEALAGFERFPSWMWRNADVLDFIGWLHDHNERVYSLPHQVGFYGLDLYSLHKSIDEVVSYLEQKDPVEAARARALYGCINRYGRDPQHYGLMVVAGMGEGCRNEVVKQFVDLRAKEIKYLSHNGPASADEFFFAEQNARVVKNAEEYYRKMFDSEASSWNQRDEHMMETLVSLMAHLQSHHGSAKVVVWAHNSHLGDARATEMASRGELNLGQLTRQTFPGQCKLIGFTTSIGSVTAASGWHLSEERKLVRPALEGSYEHLFHQVGIPKFWIDLTEETPAVTALKEPRLERAIGVVYLSDTERRHHYFDANLAGQFDAVLHFDQTRAVEPLEKTAAWSQDEVPETFPVGL
ncbi:MAG: erythromycin esterase family protein [Luteolibacter sp.]